MEEAVSSGLIPYRTTRGKREYLVLKSRTRDWEFPKGTVEDEEELQQTAKREVKEETGISGIKIIDGFREDYSYYFEIDNTKIHKTVHLFVGHAFENSVSLSKEHVDYQWRTYDEAKNTLTHSGVKNILTKVHKFLDEQGTE